MSFFKSRNGGEERKDPTGEADAALAGESHPKPKRSQKEAPEGESAADRELPSVNAKKKGNKAANTAAIVFIGILGVFLIYQMNSGKSRKDRAAEKLAQQEAKANAINPNGLPKIARPEKPAAPDFDGVQPDATPLSQASAPAGQPGQVPAPNGAQPINVQSNGQSAYAQQAGRNQQGQQVKTPWEMMRDRRRLGSLAVKYDGGSSYANQSQGSQGTDYNSQRLAQLDEQRRQGPAGSSGYSAGAPGYSSASQNGGANSGGNGSDELGKSLQPTITRGTLASKLFNRTYLIPKGAFIDCTLETRIDSTVPGMTSCILSKNVYSDNGKLILLDRGSKIVGQYQGGLKQGQARIFVLWTRVETPVGVVINLDSPGTDPLGGSGLPGYVDTHFWERFGGAIMLSMIQDGLAYVTKQQESNNSTNITFGNSQQAAQNMATEALKNSINIPPTLFKNHGEHINIYVARDLDFRSVYGVRAK